MSLHPITESDRRSRSRTAISAALRSAITPLDRDAAERGIEAARRADLIAGPVAGELQNILAAAAGDPGARNTIVAKLGAECARMQREADDADAERRATADAADDDPEYAVTGPDAADEDEDEDESEAGQITCEACGHTMELPGMQADGAIAVGTEGRGKRRESKSIFDDRVAPGYEVRRSDRLIERGLTPSRLFAHRLRG